LNPTSKKILASLASIEREILNGPPPGQGFVKSPVESIAKSSGKVDAASLSKAGGAFARGARRVWKQVLAPAGIWVWKDEPESLLSAIPGAGVVIIAAASKLGINAGLAASAPEDVVFNWLHNRANDPVLHEAVIAALFHSSPTRAGELWEFVAFLKGVLE
jgi:hypothetical protein